MKEKKPDKNNIGVLSWIINVILLSAFWPAGVILLIMRLSGNDVISKLLMQLFSKVEEHREDTARFDPLMPQANSSSKSRAARQGIHTEQQVCHSRDNRKDSRMVIPAVIDYMLFASSQGDSGTVAQSPQKSAYESVYMGQRKDAQQKIAP